MGHEADTVSPVPTRHVRRCSPHPNVSGVRPHHAAEHAEKCGFPRSVGSKDGEQFAGLKLETHVVDRAEPPESTDEAYRLQPETQRSTLTGRRIPGGGGHPG